MMSPRALTELSEEETMLQGAALDFARTRLAPVSASMDRDAALQPELIDELFSLGLMGIEVSETHGGAGSSFFAAVLAIEALATVDASVAVLVDVQNTLVQNAIGRWGTPEQRERYQTALCSNWVGSYALSESGSGSDAFALKTRAQPVAGGYELDGEKLWITNAAESQVFIVFATVDPNLGYKGITAFLVERGARGFTIGKKEDKLGIRASSTCSLQFDGCRVEETQVLGEVGKGYKVAIETLNEGRIGIGAQMLGIAQGAFDLGLAYLHERKQFGSRLVDFQGVQFQYAELATEIEAARLLVYNAARLKDRGLPFVKEAAMAKLFSSSVAEKVSSMTVEFFGGIGFTKECAAEKFYRDAKIGKIYEGTSNMQRLTIAKLLREQA